jgi:hypothetical protein
MLVNAPVADGGASVATTAPALPADGVVRRDDQVGAASAVVEPPATESPAAEAAPVFVAPAPTP